LFSLIDSFHECEFYEIVVFIVVVVAAAVAAAAAAVGLFCLAFEKLKSGGAVG